MLPCWRRNPAVATYSFGTLPHDQAQLGHLPPTLRREDTDKGTGGGGPCIPSPRLGTDALPIFVTPLLTVCWHAEHNATGLRPMSAMPPAAHARNMGHDARAGRPRLDRKSRSRQGSPRADSNALVSSGLRRHIPNNSRKADIGRIAWLRAAQRACVATPRGWFDSCRTIAQYGCEAGDGSVSVGPVASTATDQRSRSVGS